jgi:hypothetical protein
MNQKYQQGQADKKGQQNNQGKHAQSQGGQENKKSAPGLKHDDQGKDPPSGGKTGRKQK